MFIMLSVDSATFSITNQCSYKVVVQLKKNYRYAFLLVRTLIKHENIKVYQGITLITNALKKVNQLLTNTSTHLSAFTVIHNAIVRIENLYFS